MNTFKTLLYNKKDAIACITLNRPENLNAYSTQMRDDLYEVLRAIKDDNEVRVVVINGAGEKAFCAGADLSEFLTAPPPVEARQIRFRRDIWGLFLSIPQPMIAALHGYVLGSGIEIAMFCDIRLASQDSRFGLPEAGLGIIPAAGGTQTLPRLIGKGKALEMLLLDKWTEADEAYRIGLVNRIVQKENLIYEAERMAYKIASLDPLAVRLVKKAVVKGMDLTLRQGLDLEKRLALRLAGKKKRTEE